MLIGKRVAKLREAHGESLREAALRTGVSHTTIARIEKGEVTGSFHSTLRKIADGYNVRVEFLMTGRDPKQDFEMTVRRLPVEERNRLYFASTRTRIGMVIDFLTVEYPSEFSLPQIALAAGYDLETFEQLVDQCGTDNISDHEYRRLTDLLSKLTGISRQWFRWGAVGGDTLEMLPTETAQAYINLMRKAARAGIGPQVLDLALDLLIMKGKEERVAADQY